MTPTCDRPTAPDPTLDLSVVVPVLNEAESLPGLLAGLVQAIGPLGCRYEILCIDDGSTDGTEAELQRLAHTYAALRVIVLRRNYGQTAALAAGFDHARGRVIVTIDGDLQNDPGDIPRLLGVLEQGFDLVSGWRQHRQDAALTRRLPSQVANRLIGWVTGVPLHDYGCGLKAYRAEVLRDMNLYGELHRFLPALAFIEGARITEMVVRHHRRQFGHSKYGLGRSLRVCLDLLTVYFMKKFLTQPMQIFGSLGLGSMVTGLGLAIYLAVVKFAGQQDIGDRPLLVLAVVLFLAGIQLFSVGLLAELVMRTYHESQQRPIYRVRARLNFDSAPQAGGGEGRPLG
jgi:glycosyltransferase involved in cell wall biosynthesis